MNRFRYVPLMIVVLLVTGVFAASAQETDPTAANQANDLAWILYVRNGHMPELIKLLNSDTYTAASPFAPQGSAATIEGMVKDETAYQAAFPDIHFSQYLVLTEGDSAAYIAFQEGTFKNTYLDMPPTGKMLRGQLLDMTQFVDGKAIRDFSAWNQQGVLQTLGLAPADYTFEEKPWNVKIGTTGSTPAENHAALQTVFDSLAKGDVAAITPYYQSDVVAHDYLQDRQGIDSLTSLWTDITKLPSFKSEESHFVCQGDLCMSWALASTKTGSDSTYMIWSALHRFVNGKIAEEWWEYDNATLWPLLPESF